LLVAGAVNIVAANQPPAAASANEESQIEVECMFPPDHFVLAFEP
jgi:hypothetical protein